MRIAKVKDVTRVNASRGHRVETVSMTSQHVGDLVYLSINGNQQRDYHLTKAQWKQLISID